MTLTPEAARAFLEDAGLRPTDRDLSVIEANERVFGAARRALLAADFSGLPIEESPDYSREPQES
jgi:hypothetical protein